MIAIGGNRNITCMNTTGNILWINAPFECTHPVECSNGPIIHTHSMESAWREMEQHRQECDERKRFEPDIQFIRSELVRLKESTASLITANAQNPLVPLQFFNVDTIELARLQAVAKDNCTRERERLESELAEQYQQIENAKRLLWMPYVVKPIRIHGIENAIAVENYPLTELERKLANQQFLTSILASNELTAHVCRIQNQHRLDYSNNDDEDIVWPVIEETKKCEKFSAIVTKVCDQQLSTSIMWNQNFLKYVTVDNKVIDVTDEHQVNAHNVKVYVSQQIL